MQSELDDAVKLDDYAQWMRLRQLKDYPYSRILGDEWKKTLGGKIAALESAAPVKIEAGFLSRHRKLLLREIKEITVMGMAKINIGYQDLIQKAPNAKQTELARHDHQRVQQLYLQFKEQDANKSDATPKADEPFAPKDPERKRRIPMNPLVR